MDFRNVKDRLWRSPFQDCLGHLSDHIVGARVGRQIRMVLCMDFRNDNYCAGMGGRWFLLRHDKPALICHNSIFATRSSPPRSSCWVSSSLHDRQDPTKSQDGISSLNLAWVLCVAAYLVEKVGAVGRAHSPWYYCLDPFEKILHQDVGVYILSSRSL